MIHDESDVVTDDELVIRRDCLKSHNMHVYTYEMNTLEDLSCFML